MFDFDGNIIVGELPKRASKFVQEWISFHRSELDENWEHARNGEPLNYIAPLD